MSGYGGKKIGRLIGRNQRRNRKAEIMAEHDVLRKAMEAGKVDFKLYNNLSWCYEEKVTGFKIEYNPNRGIIIESTGRNIQGCNKKIEALFEVAKKMEEYKIYN